MTAPIVAQKRGRILAERVVSELAADIRQGELRPGRRESGMRADAAEIATVVDLLAMLELRIGVKAIPRAALKLPDQALEARREYLETVNREHEDIYGAIARRDADGDINQALSLGVLI